MGNLSSKNVPPLPLERLEVVSGVSAASNKFLIGPEGDGHVPGNPDYVRFVFVSDTHTMHSNLKLPRGDVLIHTGDFTFQGSRQEVESFSEWLATLDFKHKLVIAGNHEITFDLQREQLMRSRFRLG